MSNPYDSNQDEWDSNSYNDTILDERMEQWKQQFIRDKKELENRVPYWLYLILITTIYVLIFLKNIPELIICVWYKSQILYYKTRIYLRDRKTVKIKENDKKTN